MNEIVFFKDCSSSEKALWETGWGWGAGAQSSMLFSLPLDPNVLTLNELQGLLVLKDLEQLHGALLVGAKATHLLDPDPHKCGVLGEVPMGQLCLSFLTSLATL